MGLSEQQPGGRRTGPRTAKGRARRRRRLFRRTAIGLGVVVVVGAVVGGLLLTDAVATRRHLEASRTAMQGVVSALASGDADAAAEQLDTARDAIGQARASSSGPWWQVASLVPVAGRNPTVVREVVRVGETAVAAADAATRRAASLLGGDGAQLQVDEGAFDLGQLRAARQELDGLPVDALVDARDALRDTATGGVLGEVLEGRRDALALAERAIGTLDSADTLLDVLPALLGQDGPRRYLLGIQSSAELRGTGGLMGYVGVLEVEEGRMVLEQSSVVDPASLTGEGSAPSGLSELGGGLDQPVDAPPAFAERYEHVGAAQRFSNVNVDPDLPTVGPVALELFEQARDTELDGMILFDPVGLGQVLSAIGPVELPEQLLADLPDGTEGLPATIRPADLARVTLVDVYEVFGDGRTTERATYFEAVSRGAFERVFGGSWDAVAVARQLGTAAAGRHVQVFSRDQDEQQAFQRLGVGGALAPRDGGDLLAITANNAVGGKQDVHLGHRFTGDLQLGPPVDVGGSLFAIRDGTLQVEVTNPLPASGRDTYIIGNCLVGEQEYGCFRGPPGVNRTWFTIWSDLATQVTSVTERGEAGSFFTIEQIHGHRASDVFLETSPESTNGFAATVEGEAPVRREGGQLVYDLTLWRQAKAIPDVWDLTVRPPDGWDVAAVEVAGGVEGARMGVNGEAEAVTGEVVDEGDAARIHGAATTDVRIQVRMGRSWTRALRDWWSEPVF